MDSSFVVKETLHNKKIRTFMITLNESKEEALVLNVFKDSKYTN